MTSESSRAAIARAPWSACPGCWNSPLSQNWWGARRMRQSHKTDAPEHVTAGAGSASLSTASRRGAAGRRGGRLECAGTFLTQAHGGTRRCASPSVCRVSPCCGKPCRTAPPMRPTPSLRPRSPPSSTPPEVCPETMDFDIRCRHGTTTTHAPHLSPKVAWDTTSARCQVGRTWRLRLHERRLAWWSPGKK